MNTVALAGCPFVPWRNGGGRTRELLAWPSAGAWQVRVSVAEVEADGPFSAYPGVDRCFAVLDGAGVVLRLHDIEHRLGPHDGALTFLGEAAPMCRLVGGPTRDLNLMVRRGGGGVARLQRTAPGPGRWRSVFADGTLHWSDDPHEPLPVTHGWFLSA